MVVITNVALEWNSENLEYICSSSSPQAKIPFNQLLIHKLLCKGNRLDSELADKEYQRLDHGTRVSRWKIALQPRNPFIINGLRG